MDNDDFINLNEMDEALSAFDGVAAPDGVVWAKETGLYLALPAVFKG